MNTNFEAFILGHFEKRPLMEPVDVYKLLYQGVFGVGHILGENAWKLLQHETEQLKLETQPEEPLVEDASPDRKIVRINLRPFVRRGLPLSELYASMISSRIDGDDAQLLQYWNSFTRLASSGRVRLEEDKIQAITRSIGPGNCPLMHHSARSAPTCY